MRRRPGRGRGATPRLRAEGLERGKAAPAGFNSPARAARARVRGDDFVVAGPRVQVEHIKENIQEWYEVAPCLVEGLGTVEKHRPWQVGQVGGRLRAD